MNRIFSKSIALVLFTLLLLVSVESYASDKFLVVAKVNSDVITNYDLSKRYNFLRKTSSSKISNKSLKQQALNSLIEDSLYTQKAKELQLEVKNGDVNKSIEKLELSRGMYIGETREYFRKMGISYSDYLNQARAQLLFAQIVEKDIKQNIRVINYEIDEYIESLAQEAKINKKIKNNVGTKYLLSEVYIPAKKRNFKSKEWRLAKASYNNLKSDLQKATNQEWANNTFNKHNEIMVADNKELFWVKDKDLEKRVLKRLRNKSVGFASEPIYLNSRKMKRKGYVSYKIHDIRFINDLDNKQREEVKITLMNKKLDAEIERYMSDLKASNYIQIFKENIR